MPPADGHAPDATDQLDLDGVVVERFQGYLGVPDDLSPDSDLLADLGLDSIGLVTILLDLADEFNLDLASSRVNLADIRTLGDVMAVVRTLRDDAAAAG